MEIRHNLANLIINSNIEQYLIEARNCENKYEFTEKIKNGNFYADHLEIYMLSKLLNIIIAIFIENKGKWEIIKHTDVSKPDKIALINFEESSHEIGNHYNALIIKGNDLRGIIENKQISQDNLTTENNVKILIWNARSLNDVTKRIFLADILNNNTPDIAIILETFLLDEFNLYIKNYKTNKTRNIIKRKGVTILIHKNIIASIIKILNDINGRYIKLSINASLEKSYTIAGIYLEPNGDKESIPEEIYESDLIIGDMNNCDSGLNKYVIYHYKNMKITKEISINNKISDHNILLGEANMIFKRSEIYTEVDIVDKNYVKLNSNIINEVSTTQKIRKFVNPHKIIKINNYNFNPKDLSRYKEWEKTKEYNKQ